MHDAQLNALRAAARRAELLMRLARALKPLPIAATMALAAGSIVLAARKIAPNRLTEAQAWAALVVLGLSVLVVVAVQLLRKLPPYAGALALDRHHALGGRLSNALEFAAQTKSERSPFEALAIADALAFVKKGLKARDAVQLRLPREFALTALVLVGVLGLSLLEVRTLRPAIVVATKPTVRALTLSDDDLALFRQTAKELSREDQSPEMKRALQDFNQVLEDIAERRISRAEAFRRMRKIEDGLLKDRAAQDKATAEALRRMAKELEKSDLAKETAKALKKNDLNKAQKALKKLASTLRAKGKKKPSPAQLQRLREAMKRAAKANQKAKERLETRRAQLKKRLLRNKKRLDKAKTDKERKRERRLLKKKERQLKRLRRQAKRLNAAARSLSRLDRQLAKAAADLLESLGLSAKDLEGLAEDLKRLEQQQLSQKEKEELRKRLQQMRELIRQQGQGGKALRKRLQRFTRRAGAGGRARRPGQPGAGKPGGRQGQGKGRRPGQSGSGQPGGQGSQPGSGNRPGGGMGLGPGGVPIPVAGGGAPGGGQGTEPGGKGAGTGSKNPIGDKKTDIKGGTRDVRAQGIDNKKGRTTSQVILGAADRGFRGKPYRRVYRKYQSVAEDQIQREKIPDGMRFYVRRYFQLIRPRE